MQKIDFDFADCTICGKRLPWDRVNMDEWEFSDEIDNLVPDHENSVKGVEIECLERMISRLTAVVAVSEHDEYLQIERVEVSSSWHDFSLPELVGMKFVSPEEIEKAIKSLLETDNVSVQCWVVT